MIDEVSRERLAMIVARQLKHEALLEALAELFIARGPPANVRSDNGSGFIATAVQKWLAQVTPTKPVPDHEYDTALDPPVIDPRNAMRQWKIWLNLANVRVAQQPKLRSPQHFLDAAVESLGGRERE